jgi:diguanylate cyclase (GGDEF)-like protein/PAS domain S-box-containing protein
MAPEDLQALRRSETQYRTIVDRAPIGLVLTDRDGLIVVANPAFQRMIGYSEEELRTRHLTEIIAPDHVPKILKIIQQTLAGHGPEYASKKRYIRKDGTSIWVRVSFSVLFDTDDFAQGVIAMQEDITDSREVEEALRASEARYREIFQHNRTIQLLIDPETGQIVDANPAACAFYGTSLEDLQSTTIHALNVLSADMVAAEMARAHREKREYLYSRHRLHSGEVRDVEVHSNAVQIDGQPLLYSIVHDITESRMVEAQLIYQTLHDPLTGLPNRILLHDRLDQSILRAQRDRQAVTLVVMDLDGFKEINATFGDDVGDLLLHGIGLRLQQALRESDSVVRLVPSTVARIGGDEFAIILPNTDEPGAITVAHRLLEALSEPILAGEKLLTVGASMGIAVFPAHGRDSVSLLRRTDVALYLAKQKHGTYAVYDPAKDEYSPQRHAMGAELRSAIKNERLYLHYQPLVTCLTGQTRAVEALSRWKHPQHGMVPPADFIPLAEHTGLIVPLTKWVLQEALGQCRSWRTAGRDVDVSINLSAHSLSDPQLTETIEYVVRTVGAQFDWLEVEITESTVMADVEHSMSVLQELYDLGVRVSVDDFGTGYSSLTYLRRLPIHAVKIDRSFVMEMTVNEEDALIVRSVIDLAHNLGLEVVAEGVEDEAGYDMLVSMGCEAVQGYYLSRPLSAERVTAWLAAESGEEVAT